MFKAIKILRELKNKAHDECMALADVDNSADELKKLNDKIDHIDKILEKLYNE